MTLGLGDLRTLAWRTFDCDSCGELAGHRCIAQPSGTRTPPHAARLTMARGWDARQSEVDALQQALDLRDATISADEDALRRITTERDGLKTDLAAANLEVTQQGEQIAALTSDLAVTKAEFAAYVKAHPDTPPTKPPTEPTTQTTRFGACPRKGKDGADVVARWGKGAAVRLFCGTEVPTRPAGAGVVHVSWKPSAAQITDAWVQKVCAPLVKGDCVEVWHELDKKITDGVLAAADGVARKNAFFDIVVRVRPDLLVVDTRTGWSLDPKSGKNPRALKVRAHVLGVDCDGVRPTKLPYTDYQAETATALAMVAEDNDYEWFAVPELGCPRIPAEDPDGTVRAAWHDKYAKLWADSGKCLYVTLYEYDSSVGYSLTGDAEMAGWKAHV